MGSSLRIARVSGIDIRVHVSFVLIVLLGAFQWGSTHGAVGAAFGALLILLLFTCVVLHELGHSLVAQRLGVRVKEIVLLPIGGVARLQGRPAHPWHELVIALAGPAVNVVLALVLVVPAGRGVATVDLKGQPLMEVMEPSLPTLLVWLLSANISLAVFNMIPALPLDGGRVLRALLEMRLGAPRATAVASAVGQILALGLGLFGLTSGNLILAVIAFFIFVGAGQERVDAEARVVLKTLRVGDACNKHALVLSPGDTVGHVVDYILTSYQPDFAVMQGSEPIGIVTRADVLAALAAGPPTAYVTGIMRRAITRVEAGATLDAVREVMVQRETEIVAVYDGEVYVGLVSASDIAEAHLVVSFLSRHEPGRAEG